MEKRGKRKRKQKPSAVSKETTASAVLLAALSSQNPDSHRPLLNKSLNELRHSYHNPLLLSLLPTLLTRTSAPLASRAAAILGSAALHSLDLNRTIASDADIIRALLSAVSNANSSFSVAACNALLDLCTTSVGRRRLVESSALPVILFRFLRLRKSSTTSVIACSAFSHCKDMSSVRVGFKGDELSVLILNAAIILINTCDIEQLEKIPGQLSQALLEFMRNLWVNVRNAMSVVSTFDCTRGGEVYVSNIRVSHVAKSLFKLSICVSRSITPLSFRVVERGVFGLNESGFRDFVLNRWEVEPFLVRRLSPGGKIEENDFFGLLSVNLVGQYPAFLSSVLSGMVSCLPIGSDELNILTFLDEVQDKLGCPLIYQQDIRVVKTKSKKEVHFFVGSQASCSIEYPHYLSTEDVSKCEEAYKEGYTVALRGMEFRFDGVAAIAEGLASIFGQPSVGANMYLTPPNSQGLACHYDDHCVFVCQLVGTKRWRVSSQSNIQLPRLYDPLDILHGSEVQNSMDDCKQYLLREGDIMYIPRGVLHEACTENLSHDGSASCSLHITLGIEVEPPFGWEGFLHLAFFSWNQNQKLVNNSFESSSGVIHDISANLFHVVIGLLGDSDPFFRKACLVASIFSGSHTHNWLDLNQRSVFCQLIDKISTQTRFLEVLRIIELAVLENKDPLQRIKWLGFLNLEKESSTNHDQNMPFMGMNNLLSLCIQHKNHVEAAFQQLKSSFCENVIFEDAIVSYKVLLDKYRKVRQQYMNGMVSLHHQL